MDYPHHLYCKNVRNMAIVALHLKKSRPAMSLDAALKRAFSGSDMPSDLQDQAIIAAKNWIKFLQQQAAEARRKQLVLISPRERAIRVG